MDCKQVISLTHWSSSEQDGDRFWRMPEAHVRGNTIKYLRVPDEVIDKVKEASHKQQGKLLTCLELKGVVRLCPNASICTLS